MNKTRQNTQGIKRKRYEPSTKEKDVDAKLAGKLHHDLKEVRKAAKRAKTFEMQKLVKKLKGLRLKSTSEQDITECESQLEELKEISHEAVAHTALKTKLIKDRELSKSEPIQAAISQEINTNILRPAQGTTPAAKVQSRLLSSKILAAEVATTLEDLRLVLHPSDVDALDDDTTGERPSKMKKLASSDEGDVAMVDDADPTELVETEDVDDEDAGWESGTIGDDEKEAGDDWDSLASDEEDHMEEDNPTMESGPSVAKQKVSNTTSTFLPTLSTGFIRGDSSDWSDGEERAADLGVKKNRRGQRARRAIWEKKYGSNANHKKKEAAETVERGKRRWQQPASTGTRPAYKASKRENVNLIKIGHPERVRDNPTQANQEQKPLHPSWEAKKKLKEKLIMSIGPPPPGRKITFS